MYLEFNKTNILRQGVLALSGNKKFKLPNTYVIQSKKFRREKGEIEDDK